MPNNAGLAGGAGFFEGFNRIFTPFVMGQVQNQQQAQMQNQLLLRKELNSTLAPLMDHGLLDENNQDEVEAMNYAMASDANAKPPKNLATTMAVWRGRMQQLQQGIADPEAVAQAEPQTPVDARMQQAVQGAQKIREGGGTITFRGKNGSISYAGQSFTEQQKRKVNQAYQRYNKGNASLDEITGSLGLGPDEESVVRDRVAQDVFTQLVEQGAGREEAARAAIVGTRSMLPQLVEMAFGTQQAAEKAIATGRANISLIPEKTDAEREARIAKPLSPEERAAGVEAGTMDPEANKRIQKTLAGEDRPKLSGPTATERAAIAERESQIEQLQRIETLLPKTKVLGKIAGTLAGVSEEYLGGLGLSEDDLTVMTEINGFRNRIIKMLSGGAVPAAEYDRVQKELPDVKLDAKVNRVRIKRTLLNLKTLQKKYGETLFQSGVTNLPESVAPADAAPAPAASEAPAPAAEPAPFKILSVEPVTP